MGSNGRRWRCSSGSIVVILIMCCVNACVMDDADYDDDGRHPCRCDYKRIMRIERLDDDAERQICNNATVNWLLNTALERITKQSEWLKEMIAEMKNKEEELSRGYELVNLCEKEADRLQNEAKKLKSSLDERDAKILLLEAKLHFLENERHQKEKVENTKDDNDDDTWPEKETRINEERRHHPTDCSDVQKSGMKYSGIYTIYPRGTLSPDGNGGGGGVLSPDGVEVFCDLNTDGGRWTVIQRRQDGSESFERNWNSYKTGFGVLAKEFWLGNENIYLISNQRPYQLRVDLIDFNSDDYVATYDTFSVSDESDNFRLSVGKYSGNAGDAFSSHDESPFSTIETDNDASRSGNCSELYGGGGWWFSRCYDANLNGRYRDEDVAKTIVWFRLPRKGLQSMRSTEMKIRPRESD